MKRVIFKVILYGTFGVFLMTVFTLTVLNTMDVLVKGEEMETPDFVNMSLFDARDKAMASEITLKEMPLNSELVEPETVISQYPIAGTKIKKSGNKIVKVFFAPKKSEVVMPDLGGLNIVECKKVLKDNHLKWYFSFVYSDTAPIDFVISQSYVPGMNLQKGSRVGVLFSKGKKRDAFIMPEVIGKSADEVIAFFEEKGIKISNITFKTYEGLAPGIIINQSPRLGFRINDKSMISLEVSE